MRIQPQAPPSDHDMATTSIHDAREVHDAEEAITRAQTARQDRRARLERLRDILCQHDEKTQEK